MLVTVRFNSTIAGGMVVRLGSRMYDWSWRRLLMEQRSNYAEVLRRV
jgi:F0F1-type ATP synthase delta subunit